MFNSNSAKFMAYLSIIYNIFLQSRILKKIKIKAREIDHLKVLFKLLLHLFF